MGRPRSLVGSTEVQVVKLVHACQGDKSHLLAAGQLRLNVRSASRLGARENYCLACAVLIVERDLEALGRLLGELRSAALEAQGSRAGQRSARKK